MDAVAAVANVVVGRIALSNSTTNQRAVNSNWNNQLRRKCVKGSWCFESWSPFLNRVGYTTARFVLKSNIEASFSDPDIKRVSELNW